MTLAASSPVWTPTWRLYLAPAFVVLVSAGALGVAFTAQYGFGLLPCVLCVWQRWAYGAALAFGVLGLGVARWSGARRLTLALAGVAFLAVTGLALYHVGVEQGWWTGSETCQGADFSSATTRDQLKAAILKAPVVACNDVPWSLGGISIAGFNAIFSFLFALATFWLALRKAR